MIRVRDKAGWRLPPRGVAPYDAAVDAWGATLPAASAFPNGTHFLHVPGWPSPTRVYKYQNYNGTWVPLESLAATTLYVDATNGTDSQGKGTGTGTAAYATPSYAWSQLPPRLAGNVTINLAAGTYREQLTCRGKTLTGDYTITLTGALTLQAGFPQTATSGANPAGNGSAGYGTITKAAAGWTVNAYRDLILYITSGTGAGQFRVIHGNTATVITIVGRWDTVPDNTSVFEVYDLGTRITGADAGADTTPVRAAAIALDSGQRGVTLQLLKLDYCTSSCLQANNASALVAVQFCRLANSSAHGLIVEGQSFCQTFAANVVRDNLYGVTVASNSVLSTFYQNRVTSTATGAIGLYLPGGKLGNGYQSYLGCSGAGAYQAYVGSGGTAIFDHYMEWEGSTGAPSADGVYVIGTAVVTFAAALGATATQRSLNNGGWGVQGYAGGVVFTASGLTYSGNVAGTRTPTTQLAGGTD